MRTDKWPPDRRLTENIIATLVASNPHIQAVHQALEDGTIETVAADDLP